MAEKSIYLSTDKMSKTNQFLKHSKEPFPVYLRTLGDTISYILCTAPCVNKITKQSQYLIRAVFQIKLFFNGLITGKKVK